MLYGAAPPFNRIFDALERDQRVDAAQSPKRYCRTLRLRGAGLAQRKTAARSPPCRRRRRRRSDPVWSFNAHK
jgi:hypothetical protein